MSKKITAKQRAEEELRLLNQKIIKLRRFLFSPKFHRMNAAEKQLLLSQFQAMRKYAWALEARLSIWREVR